MPLFRQSDPLVTVEFQEAPLRTALQIVLDSANAQYNIGPKVGGMISFGRTQLPLRKMLALLLTQVIDPSEIEEQNGVFHIRNTVEGKNSISRAQKLIDILKVSSEASKNAPNKLAKLPPGTILARMSGYAIVDRKIQSESELTVVRLTERETVLRSDDGKLIKAPLAGYQYYQP